MLRTRESDYIISSVQRHHVWFEVMEGDDTGIRVSVPLRDDTYSESVESVMKGLQENDMVRATLVSETEERPHWKVESIQKIGTLT